MSSIRALMLASAASLVAVGHAAAQAPEETARETVERDQETLEEPQRARERRADSDGAVAFEQILAAPQDVQLNLAYARERVEAGDLKEAAAALERVLLVQPNLYSARVLYGLVLFRLQMYDRARFELEKALEGDLPPRIRAEAEVYLERIRELQKRTRTTITLATGVEWDENRTQATSSGQVLFLDIPLPGAPGQSDFAHILSAQGRIHHDLGKQNGAAIFGEAGYFRSDKFEVDRLDLDAVSASLGMTWNWGNLSVTPSARGSFIWLNDADYLASIGGELEILYRWAPHFRTYLKFRGDDEDFRATPDFSSSPERSGRRLSGRAGLNWNIDQTQAVTLEGLFMDKKGAVAYESYDRYGVFAQHLWLHGHGVYTLVGLWAENSSYDGVDAFISPSTVRDEWLYRARVTAGAPLSIFAPGLPEPIGDINIIAQYEYETVDSNILNYDYDTHKVNLLLSKRFAF